MSSLKENADQKKNPALKGERERERSERAISKASDERGVNTRAGMRPEGELT